VLTSSQSSPVSDGGRGLKLRRLHRWHGSRAFARQRWRAWIETSWHGRLAGATAGSPVSDGGRGLKPSMSELSSRLVRVRPSAMAGVD